MRKPYATSLDDELIKKIKILAIEQGRNVNDILEEALKDYLKKCQ